jgi:peptidoglycan-associated lipoprotein
MKKIILTTLAAATLSTTLMASSQCPTTQERISFGAIGVIQGAVIGGPVGAFWALGMAKYADSYDDQACHKKEIVNDIEVLVDTKLDTIKTQVQEEESVSNTVAVVTNTSKSVEYNSIVNFDFNSYIIKSIPSKLQALNNKNIKSIQINGHTDKVGTDEYNFALGLKRANAVKQLLIDANNISTRKLKTTSYGESAPISTDDAKNRRVDLTIEFK